MIIGVVNTFREIVASYLKDDDEFRVKNGYISKRKTDFIELDYLWEIFFPWGFKKDPNSLEKKLFKFNSYLEDTIGIKGAYNLFGKLSLIRERLKTDIIASYNGDPSANSYFEIIRSFPGFESIMIHRFSHEAYNFGFGEYAREISELSHQRTGIDIHPGAEIGNYFFIDHGTGVVIGETTSIGDNVRLYHQVTLGAFKFEKDENDEQKLKKGYKRHPNIGDDVVIGTGVKILGPVNIGNRVKIGVNSLITEDVDDDSFVFTKNGNLIVKN